MTDAEFDQRMKDVRHGLFKHVKDDNDWAFVVSECKRVGLDPVHIYVVHELDDRTGEMQVCIRPTLAGFRQSAINTGQRKSESAPKWLTREGAWVTEWTSDEPPREARAYVTRFDSDEPFEGIATFKMSAVWESDPGGANPRLSPGWRRDSASRLGQCAIAAAYRAAGFGGGLVTAEEAPPGSLPKFARETERILAAAPVPTDVPPFARPMPLLVMPASATPDDPWAAERFVDESTPESVSDLKTNLFHSFLSSMSQAEEVVNEYRAKFPKTFAQNPRGWCAIVLKEIAAKYAN